MCCCGETADMCIIMCGLRVKISPDLSSTCSVWILFCRSLDVGCSCRIRVFLLHCNAFYRGNKTLIFTKFTTQTVKKTLMEHRCIHHPDFAHSHKPKWRFLLSKLSFQCSSCNPCCLNPSTTLIAMTGAPLSCCDACPVNVQGSSKSLPVCTTRRDKFVHCSTKMAK